MRKRFWAFLICLATLASLLLNGCQMDIPSASSTVSLGDIPPYSGEAYVILEDNMPGFDLEDFTLTAFEYYSELDHLGRCGVAYANICEELMPTETRGSIGQVKPSGWQTIRYDFVDGQYLYNRCHLIGYQLAGENANIQNLITGTRYMNTEGMLPFENLVAGYVKDTGNHVLYRVTPVFDGDCLVASGVQMEAISVEDEGEGVCFNVFVYNVQPGVIINYATGGSELDETAFLSGEEKEYILNVNSRKFHDPDCGGAADIRAENRQEYIGTRELLIAQGYAPCGLCKP